MNQFTIYIDKDLTPRWNEFPKEENFVDFENDFHESKYSAALQKAKGEAIPFDIRDEHEVKLMCAFKSGLKPDSIYTIDYDGTVERRLVWDSKKLCSIEVARLIPSKPKEEPENVTGPWDAPDEIQLTIRAEGLNEAIEKFDQLRWKIFEVEFDLMATKYADQEYGASAKSYPEANHIWQCGKADYLAGLIVGFKKFTLYDESIRTVAGTGTTPFSTPEKPDNSKPDFEAMANEYVKAQLGEEGKDYILWSDMKDYFKAGMEKLYSDIYLPKVREMEERINNQKQTIEEFQNGISEELGLKHPPAYYYDCNGKIQELRDKIKDPGRRERKIEKMRIGFYRLMDITPILL